MLLEHCLCHTQDDTQGVAPGFASKKLEKAKLMPYPRRHPRSCADYVVLGNGFRHLNLPKMTVVLGKICLPKTTPKTTCLFLAIQSRWFKNRAEAADTSRHDPLCPDLSWPAYCGSLAATSGWFSNHIRRPLLLTICNYMALAVAKLRSTRNASPSLKFGFA